MNERRHFSLNIILYILFENLYTILDGNNSVHISWIKMETRKERFQKEMQHPFFYLVNDFVDATRRDTNICITQFLEFKDFKFSEKWVDFSTTFVFFT